MGWSGEWGTGQKGTLFVDTHRLKNTKSAMPVERRTHLTLVGHSLGGRIVARALSKVASDGINPKKVRVA